MDDEQRMELQRIAASRKSTLRDAMRARVILERMQGRSQAVIAQEFRVGRRIVSKWCARFAKKGLAGLVEVTGRGRPERIPNEKKEKVILNAVKPPAGRSKWSTRSMGKYAGVSKATVQRLWHANDIKPHLLRTFKLSNDKNFEEKFWDVIGLYLSPPEKALVLCCDEKSQCQALERTQPGLPLGIGHIRTKTHDYTRHGTITLFAALSYLDGKIISRTAAKHTNKEWLAFLKQIDKESPPELEIHLISDNYATHKHPTIKNWLKKHPRFHQHFTPTSSSWMNMVERFFKDITDDVVRDGSFSSVSELTNAINVYLAERNNEPKRYEWKKSGEEILAKIHRAKMKLEKINA